MATHDYVISNASGAAVRADLNNALAAIVTNNSSATAPTTTYAYQWWADTGSSPAVMKLRNAANSAWITLFQLDGEWSSLALENGTAAAPSIYFKDSGTDTGFFSPGADSVAISTNGAQRVTVNSSGNVGINTASPANLLHVGGATDKSIRIDSSTSNPLYLGVYQDSAQLTVNRDGATGTFADAAKSAATVLLSGASGGSHIAFATASANNTAPPERARIDSSGRLLVGTSSTATAGNAQYAFLQVRGNSFSTANNAILNIGRGEAATSITSGEDIGNINFTDSSGNEFAEIKCTADGNAGSGSYPGRITFHTTPSGSGSFVERMRIGAGGDVLLGKTSTTITASGIHFSTSGGTGNFVASGTRLFDCNRLVDDGELIAFWQASAQEGSISVSGTTVSYNGAHLSRWSQLSSGTEREEILRGTVLSNLDEMCEWGEEDNEQLNRMKVSDVEGDKNVSGVFQAWDDDDDTYTNDFYCAMTGDFIIRIAGDVTVERGDLLMSAGDGTAKPQDDDIIRSKTIAKVTSTNVSCTYDDGSYCVPCVLMAC